MNLYQEKTLAFLRENELTSGLSDSQLKMLLQDIQEVTIPANEIIIQENETGDKIYLIKEGQVEIFRRDTETYQYHRLGLLEKGDIIGELSLIDNAPRAASVRTLRETTFLILSIARLRHIDEEKGMLQKVFSFKKSSSIYSTIIQNVARKLTGRIRNTNDAVIRSLKNELRHAKAREEMGRFFINVLLVISLYIFALSSISALKAQMISTTFISVPFIITCLIPVIYVIKRSGYPLSFYGITRRGWKPALIESILFTIPFLGLVVLYKWFLIHFISDYAHRPLFEFSFNLTSQTDSFEVKFLVISLYLVCVPIQELVVRGALQSTMQEVLVGRYNTFWAIILSNLLFSDVHTYISIGFGLLVFLPGLFWGWLYSRHRNLIGVSVSHIIVGAWAIFVVGLL